MYTMLHPDTFFIIIFKNIACLYVIIYILEKLKQCTTQYLVEHDDSEQYCV